jgi:hypothetical protein
MDKIMSPHYVIFFLVKICHIFALFNPRGIIGKVLIDVLISRVLLHLFLPMQFYNAELWEPVFLTDMVCWVPHTEIVTIDIGSIGILFISATLTNFELYRSSSIESKNFQSD